jgi:phage tail-like protein
VSEPAADRRIGPLFVFNFDVVFSDVFLPAGGAGDGALRLCGGAFSEISGLEATMEPKVIKEGGRNFGVVQRAGLVSFSPVIFKRGISQINDLWKWMELVAGGSYAKRLTATITLRDAGATETIHQWRLLRALPTKFKTADLNATAAQIGIEELHVVHEGIEVVS